MAKDQGAVQLMKASPRIFAIVVDGVQYYWTGAVDYEGKLERSEHRADAYKFSSAAVALQVADTHDELRDSEVWKIVPLRDKVSR